MSCKTTLATWLFPSLIKNRYISRSTSLYIQFIKPLGYWNSLKNQREFLDQLAKELNIKNFDDWYEINSNDVIEKGGSGFLYFYGSSLSRALMNVYKEHQWNIFKFTHGPNFWKSYHNQEAFLQFASKELKLKNWEEWYVVKNLDVARLGGRRFLRLYDDSLSKALMTLYPKLPWKPWKFNKVPVHFWDKTENFLKYLPVIEKDMNIKTPDDWYHVTFMQLATAGLSSAVAKRGGMISFLEDFYPDIDWDHEKFRSFDTVGSKSQYVVFNKVRELFPNEDVCVNYLHSGIVYPKGKMPIELDVFIPNLKLAFEYQGEQHHNHKKGNSLMKFNEARADIDEFKRNACKTLGIDLVEVPYWWDQTLESLKATIHKIRSDLFDDVRGAPIPLERPKKLKQQIKI